jgi:hypothetical protein
MRMLPDEMEAVEVISLPVEKFQVSDSNCRRAERRDFGSQISSWPEGLLMFYFACKTSWITRVDDISCIHC